ncbi:hypothetical protein CRENBAI_018622 [Crenichthys baileyi]|uniref:Uncharacterized protein n=1 Tax=Crenichthys baileyi TaxID=28760 RepID=A0AAV9SHT0_9TELE
MAFAPKVKKRNNFPKERPNHTKVGMKEDLWVSNDPMWSYADIIKATPPENRKSLFFTGKGRYLAVYTQINLKLCQTTALHDRTLSDMLLTVPFSDDMWNRAAALSVACKWRCQAPAIAAQAELR